MERSRSYKPIALVLVFALVITFSVLMPVSAATAGGWNVSKARYSFLNKSQKTVFNKATKGLSGASYKPVALLAKQTVAGTNYIYLTQEKTITAKPKTTWNILVAGKSLDNKVSMLAVNTIDLSDIKTNKKPRKGTPDGGLQIVKVKNKSKALSKKVRKIFKKGIKKGGKKYKKYKLRPIALLGTQVVAGKNYRFLCYGKTSSGGDIFVVDIYKNLKGKSKASSCKPLNLEKYTENPSVDVRRY